MTRLLISAEGHSEYKFVNEVIIPHLASFDVFVSTQNMKGDVSVDKISSILNKLIDNHDSVTTLYDFYGFKGLETNETKQSLENKIKQAIKQNQQRKIIPYIQMYEFEALLFSDAIKMAQGLNTHQTWIDKIVSQFTDVETINNSKKTAPSKRIIKNVKYIKTQHAPAILQNIGLAKIRQKCTGFDAWLTQLERL